MDDSKITISASGTSFVGRDAVELYRIKSLIAALRLNLRTGMLPTRGMTKGRMLLLAGDITGKRYKRTETERAIDDLTEFASLLASSLPIEKV